MVYDDPETITAYEEGVAEGLRQAFQLAKRLVIRYRGNADAELMGPLHKLYKSQLEFVAEKIAYYEDVE
jgi:hypothetical protein